MRCYFQETNTFETIPIEKISQALGFGIWGTEALERLEEDEKKFKFAWGAIRIDGVVYLESWAVMDKELINGSYQRSPKTA